MKKIMPQQKDLVIDILTDAFDENKSVNYVVKQDRKRKQRIRRLMTYSFNVCNAFGDIWLSDDEKACALVLLPDKKRATLSAIWWDIQLAVGAIGLTRVGNVLNRESKIKHFHPKDPFCYLWFIGVRPDSQKKGIGGGLLKDIIQEYNKQRRPIYLETSTIKNVPWYQKFGIQIFQELNFTYTLYMMRNDPN